MVVLVVSGCFLRCRLDEKRVAKRGPLLDGFEIELTGLARKLELVTV